MGRSQREKGKRGERAAAKALNETFGLDCTRSAQVSGQTGQADLNCKAAIHCEVKVRKGIGALRYLDQAVSDCLPEKVPFVLMKEDRGEWVAMVRLKDFQRLTDAIIGQADNPDINSGSTACCPNCGHTDCDSKHWPQGCGNWSEHSRHS